uniref:Uncharacterized protein n=1 Tax=Arundo donax TaxID=35708 RepID=A0A0A8ZLW6_ARUDO
MLRKFKPFQESKHKQYGTAKEKFQRSMHNHD